MNWEKSYDRELNENADNVRKHRREIAILTRMNELLIDKLTFQFGPERRAGILRIAREQAEEELGI